MTEQVMSIDALQTYFNGAIHTKLVRVTESRGIVTVKPTDEALTDCTIGLRGMFKDADGKSVEKFLEHKRTDKRLDL
ncbi:MAG: hypothetical protein LBR77_06125 [Lachnospiraceae bacterium]|jgi:hypothetical protein|nr:hypothetical protein [Lachnospiraceae bacterium]